MDSSSEAAGIDMANLAYIITPLLIVVTCIAVIIGMTDMLRVLRNNELESFTFLTNIFKSIGTVIAIIGLVYFINK